MADDPEDDGMSWFGLFLNSKGLNQEKPGRNGFSPKVQGRLRQEIAEHKEFYVSVRDTFLKARSQDPGAGEALEDLCDKLYQLYAEDKRKIDKDDCAILRELHRMFVAKKNSLENRIRKVLTCHYRMQLRQHRREFDAAHEKLGDLMREMSKFQIEMDNATEKIEMLQDMNQQLLQEQLRSREQYEAELERSRRSNESLKAQLETALAMNRELIEREREKEIEREEETRRKREKEGEREEERRKEKEVERKEVEKEEERKEETEKVEKREEERRKEKEVERKEGEKEEEIKEREKEEERRKEKEVERKEREEEEERKEEKEKERYLCHSSRLCKMRLLRRPPSDLTDVRQIKQFAQSNRIILELSKHYSTEELIEIAKYRDFFGDMERAARSLINGVEGAEIHLQKLKDKLPTMTGEAERERDRTGNEDMRSLYEYFINHYDCLTKMVLVKVSEHQKKQNVVKETNRKKTVNESKSSHGNRQLRTLEDCLVAVGLFPILLELDESLKQVRRGNKSLSEHEADCKSFDKVLVRLSREHHPDSVMRRGGSDEEVTRAKDLQEALNVTRIALNALNKLFLQDINIYHRYKSLTKLDIGTLGNEEDEVEYHVLGALYTMGAVADEYIFGEVKKFLEAAQLCVDSYLRSDFVDFTKHRDSAFFYLQIFVVGYEEFQKHLQEDKANLEKLKVHSSSIALIREIQDDCREQLQHLEGLLQFTKRPFGDLVKVFMPRDRLDDYLVLPLDCYVNVIMACSLMVNKGEDKGPVEKISTPVKQEESHSRNPPPTSGSSETSLKEIPPVRAEQDDDAINLLYKLASYYVGDKRHESFVKKLLHQESIAKKDVKGQFHVRLIEVRDDLKNRFETSDYEQIDDCLVNAMRLCLEICTEHRLKRLEV